MLRPAARAKSVISGWSSAPARLRFVRGLLCLCCTFAAAACGTTDLRFSGDYNESRVIVVARLQRIESGARVRWYVLTSLLGARHCRLYTGAGGFLHLDALDTGLAIAELDQQFLRESGQPLAFVVGCLEAKAGRAYNGFAVLGSASEALEPGVIYVLEARRLHYHNTQALTPLRIETDESIESTADIISEFRRRHPEAAANAEIRVLKLSGERLVPRQPVGLN